MGSICQCPEGMYEDLDLRTSQSRHRNYRSNNMHGNNSYVDEENSLLNKTRNKYLTNFQTKNLLFPSYVIDKEVSIHISNNIKDDTDNKKINKNNCCHTSICKSDKININETTIRPSELHSRTNSWATEYIDVRSIAEEAFKYLIDLRTDTFNIINKIELIYSQCNVNTTIRNKEESSFINNNFGNYSKKNSSKSNRYKLINDDLINLDNSYNKETMQNTNNINKYTNDQKDEDNNTTLASDKDKIFKVIKQSITELFNNRRIANSTIMWSEKCYSYLSEIISDSYTCRAHEAISSFISSQYNYKYKFKEINWIGTEDALASVTKLLFEQFDTIEHFLNNNYSFGAINVIKHNDNYEYSMFLAYKEGTPLNFNSRESFDFKSKRSSCFVDTYSKNINNY